VLQIGTEANSRALNERRTNKISLLGSSSIGTIKINESGAARGNRGQL
jgi:hypothetical protein